LFSVAAGNYILGRRINRNIADKWLKVVEPVIKENFKLIGTCTPGPDEPIEFEDNSAHEFPILLAKNTIANSQKT